MNQLSIVLAVLASIGMITNLAVESVSAWHAEFPNIKECRKAVIDTTGDTEEVNRVCEKLIPHDEQSK
jgi:hypothetical protein